MVRNRWSYLNQLNLHTIHRCTSLPWVHFKAVTDEVIYYRHPVSQTSRLVRSQLARRKHLNQWVIYNNILADWSKEYLKLRQLLRFTFTYRIFLYNYLVNNLTSSRSKTKFKNLGSLYFTKTTVTQKSLYYYQLRYKKSYIMTTTFKTIFVSFLSSWTSESPILDKGRQPNLIYNAGSRYLTPAHKPKLTPLALYNVLILIQAQLSVSIITQYYKLSILLVKHLLN